MSYSDVICVLEAQDLSGYGRMVLRAITIYIIRKMNMVPVVKSTGCL